VAAQGHLECYDQNVRREEVVTPPCLTKDTERAGCGLILPLLSREAVVCAGYPMPGAAASLFGVKLFDREVRHHNERS